MVALLHSISVMGTCGLSVTTFFHQVLNYYYLTVYIMFKPKIRVRVRVRVFACSKAKESYRLRSIARMAT